MDLSLFDHFEGTKAVDSALKRGAEASGPSAKKAKFSESGIEERLAGTVIEKVWPL